MAVIAIHRWRSVTSRMTISSCSKRSLWITIISTWVLSALMAIPLSMYNQTQEYGKIAIVISRQGKIANLREPGDQLSGWICRKNL
ncbi:unnamed protein product [Oppiella nova]|uniref:G-protein coupled receptors family 1 profile domain-containing protein n=1 Tax=Oppiella nova TaxID=334625 RepID=A0A7R9QU69_9ACAR|nr:unnamed protein product [Oppiella nova]CAG2175795.1 unnamed protein product [Oppiella nova]